MLFYFSFLLTKLKSIRFPNFKSHSSGSNFPKPQKKKKVNSPKYKFYRLFFTVYTLLTDDNVENIHAKSQAKDKNGKVIKECNFTDVHLVKGKQTCYEGNFFDNTSSSSFTVSGASLDDSGFSKHF